MMLTLALLILCAALIYLSCEYFVNGIEWVGAQYGIARSAVGTVLAAFGTALPESVVTFVAVVFGHTAPHKDLGVGAALGGPLVLATIAYAVVGLTFVMTQTPQRASLLSRSEAQRLHRDQVWFLWVFLGKVALGLLAFPLKRWLGLLFLGVYAVYTRREIQAEHEEGAAEVTLEPLKFRPQERHPVPGWALLQTGLALAVIFVSSQVFVHQLEAIGPWLGLAPQLVALLLSPLATELPETLNAIIWVRQGKATLALGNISGAMMIQATVPSAFGILFTSWRFDPALIVAAAVTILSIVSLSRLLRRGAFTGARLAWFGLLYLLFAAGLVVIRR